ncbi:ERAD-associated E3 ubiquitin-protein ligase HRD1 [Intoshia linei]|uniref:RING-type E3 ubiquitin transferase n=1 Tax=Intoshia linei TaxID=1819745 RepID=A0A177B5K0_9BILA|nr:ERAD-associated E3 ubiquitin-protein ligase HRD1 [Intoshia linei]
MVLPLLRRNPFQSVVVITTLCTLLYIGNAYRKQNNFYSMIVNITKSNFAIAMIYFELMLIFIFIIDVIRYILFGKIQSVEVEYVMDRVWFTIPETCIAFTIFRNSFGFVFGCQLIFLMVIKSSHWLFYARIDYMERMMAISKKFHLRAILIAIFLMLIDLSIIYSCLFNAESTNDGIYIIFIFEYLLLVMYLLYIFIKYCIHTIDSASPVNWENKAIYLMIFETVFNFMSMITFLSFSFAIVVYKSYPLFLVRRLFASIRAFKRSFVTIVKSRRAIYRMNEFKDITQEDLNNGDPCCVVCREEMSLENNCKKLPCGHMFHKACLRSWFRRQQICPTCRLDLLKEDAQNVRNENQRNRERPPNQNNNRVDIRNLAATIQNELTGGPTITTTHKIRFPKPPIDLQALSDKELKLMEGDLRESTINRINLLRDINVLMDAASFQMQQYNSIFDESRIPKKNVETQTTNENNASTSPP